MTEATVQVGSLPLVDSDVELAANTGMRPQRKIGARDFAWTFGTNIAIQLCTIVQAIFLARLLGPIGRGQFAAATLWPMVFASVGGLGVAIALAQRSARAQELGRITRTALILTLLTASIATLVCAASLPLLMGNVDAVSRTTTWYFLPYILFNQVALGLIAIDQGAGRFRQFNLTRLILNPAYLLIIVVLWATGTRAVHWYVLGLLAANALVALVRVVAAAKEHSLLGPLAPVWGVVRQAVPFAAAGFISPFLQSADKALVLYLVGTEELGIYTVALTVASVVNSLAASAGAVSFGIAAQEHHSNAFPRVAKIFRITAWIWLLAGGGLMIAIPVLLPIVYGSQFAPAIWPAIILVPAAAFCGQASILEESLRAQGRAFIGLEARAAGMGVFLTLGWFLARSSGLLGVSVAFVVAQFTVLTFMLWVATKHFRQTNLRALMPVFSDLRELLLRVRSLFQSARWNRAKS